MPDFRSLEIKYMARELRESLVGGKFRKIYQYGAGEKSFLFDVYISTKGSFLLYSDAEKMFITKRKLSAPETPPNFCMLLRKYLEGAYIKDIRQQGFDRILEIVTDGCILIFEFVPPGNVILCDSFRNIIVPLDSQRWKDRSVLPKVPYMPPPSGHNPYAMSHETFLKVTSAAGEEKMETFLAKMGFGPVYAKEICALSGIDPARPAGGLSGAEAARVLSVIKKTGDMPASPVTYGDGTVAIFRLLSRSDPVKKEWASLSAPLDELSAVKDEEKAKEASQAVTAAKKGKIERIVERQKDAGEKLLTKKSGEQEKADAIYQFYGIAEGVLEGIKKAREEGLSWDEIRARISGERGVKGRSVKAIKEHEGSVVVDLGGKEVSLDITKSARENAAAYYDGSKEARKKYEGLQLAIEEKMIELEGVESSPAPAPPMASQKARQKAAKPKVKWYEKFRWFFSSKRFLIVAGKDADTNEDLVKKHTEPGDLVFHTDIHGSSFVVIKAKTEKGTKFAGVQEGGTLPPEVKKEASEIAAACSNAWSQGLGAIDVYAVKPDQVSKTPPSGTSLPKGSFMIYGQREWFHDVEVKMAIGVLVERATQRAEAMAGPVMAVRTYCKYFVTVRPGATPATELAKHVRDRLGYKASPEDRVLIEAIPLESIERLIPSGTGMLVS
jgi:predicted ribosome quality control (RQC) complex YloA/Tae2 family protein